MKVVERKSGVRMAPCRGQVQLGSGFEGIRGSGFRLSRVWGLLGASWVALIMSA